MFFFKQGNRALGNFAILIIYCNRLTARFVAAVGVVVDRDGQHGVSRGARGAGGARGARAASTRGAARAARGRRALHAAAQARALLRPLPGADEDQVATSEVLTDVPLYLYRVPILLRLSPRIFSADLQLQHFMVYVDAESLYLY